MNEGPYRKQFDHNADTLQRMQKRVESEGKHLIQIPKDAKTGDKIPLFTEMLKGNNQKDLVLYSNQEGLLRYSGKTTDSLRKEILNYFFHYTNESGSFELSIKTNPDYSNAEIYYDMPPFDDDSI